MLTEQHNSSLGSPMAYTIEEIEKSQEIFYYLLKYHELNANKDKDLYKAFTDSESVQVLVRSQGKIAECEINRYEDVIYLIPNEDNYFLGFSKTDLRQQLCKSNNTEQDYYLSLFAIMVLILNFYDGYGSDCKIRDYIKFGELQNSIGEYLKRGIARHPSEDEQNEFGLMFTAMSESYESLKSDEKISRRKTTKEGFLYAIIKFLQDQDLVIFIEQDEMIKTTKKFDHFMNWNLLDVNNYERVLSVMQELENESN